MPATPLADLTRVARAVWAEPAVADPPRRVWRDWALVALIVPAAVLEGVLRDEMPWRWLTTALAVGLVPTLLWRRTHPLLMVAIAFGSFIVVDSARVVADVPPSEMVAFVYVLVLAYALFRWGSGRHALTGLAIMLVPATIAAFGGDDGVGDLVGGFAVFFTTLAVGAAIRYRAAARTRLLEQVQLVEREQLARDLHDTVAHHVSAIAIRAQAGLATAGQRPEAAVEALRVIEAEAARTLTEMRSMVRALRRDEMAELAPNPTLADVAALVGDDGPGPAVRVDLDGEPDDVEPQIATTVYRLVQEAVTNARRHARHATRIDVAIDVEPERVRVDVRDDGEPCRAPTEPGYGMLGMFERATLLGGTCTAGPAPDRGWAVTAELPRERVPT